MEFSVRVASLSVAALADRKLNAMALVDGDISGQQFRLILNGIAKYHQMKDEIPARVEARLKVAMKEETSSEQRRASDQLHKKS